MLSLEGVDTHIHGSPCYPVEQDFLAPMVGESMIDLKQEREQMSLLEEAMSRDAGREKIYSDKLG